jgi:hypothetical protein
MTTRGYLAGAVLLLAAGCGGAQWQEYTSRDGGFKVLMPGAPRQQSHDQETPQGKITFNAAVVELHQGAFVAAWADLPPKIPMNLEDAVKKIAERYGGKVKESKSVEFQGSPGREFVIDSTKKPPGQAVGRIYQVENRLYELIVVGSQVEGKYETERFLEKFHLLDPLMKPKTTASP